MVLKTSAYLFSIVTLVPGIPVLMVMTRQGHPIHVTGICSRGLRRLRSGAWDLRSRPACLFPSNAQVQPALGRPMRRPAGLPAEHGAAVAAHRVALRAGGPAPDLQPTRHRGAGVRSAYANRAPGPRLPFGPDTRVPGGLPQVYQLCGPLGDVPEGVGALPTPVRDRGGEAG